MARFRFELATAADDDELRHILARTPMEGDMVVSIRREPSYFAAAVVAGGFRQTVVGRDGQCGRIVGFGERSVRESFVNGEPRPVGYLSSLRVLPEYRNRGLVARGYAFFRQLDADRRTALYLTTIAEGNDRAISTLSSGRAGLPPYHDAGRYMTLALPTARGGSATQRVRGDGIAVRTANRDDLADILDFLMREGRRRQFFPCHQADEFFNPRGTFRELRPEDLLLAFRGQRLVGTLGVWDQRPFRQSVVERYSTRLRWLRPWYNARARLTGRPSLPQAGQRLQYATAAIPVVAADELDSFAALLRAAQHRAAELSASYLLVGLHETDPLRPHVERQAIARYITRLFLVCSSNADRELAQLDGRVPYLELGTL